MGKGKGEERRIAEAGPHGASNRRVALPLRELLETRRELGAWNEKRVVALAGVWGMGLHRNARVARAVKSESESELELEWGQRRQS